MSLLDAMHEAILAGIHPKPPREVAQTSFIYRIFGGTCRSQVTLDAVISPASLTAMSCCAQSASERSWPSSAIQLQWLCSSPCFKHIMQDATATDSFAAVKSVRNILLRKSYVCPQQG